MGENRANIGGREISSSTEIRTNLNTLSKIAIGLFSILIAMFTLFYFDMKSNDKNTNVRLDHTIEEVRHEVDLKLRENLREFDNRQRQIKDDIGHIKGDIKVILDRTGNHRTGAPHSIYDAPSPPFVGDTL